MSEASLALTTPDQTLNQITPRDLLDKYQIGKIPGVDNPEKTRVIHHVPESGDSLRFLRLDRIYKSEMSEVIKAYDAKTRRLVAIKQISVNLGEAFEDYKQRLLAEADNQDKLNSAYAIPIYDVITIIDDPSHPEEKKLGIVMAYQDPKERPTLDALIKERGKLSPEETILLAKNMAETMTQAHNQQIIHYDQKPSQWFVLLKPEPDHMAITGQVRIADFGISKILDEIPSVADTTLDIRGTVQYMSPERCTGKDNKSNIRQSEVYSFGLVVFEMLTGQGVHEGLDISEVMYNIYQSDGVPSNRQYLLQNYPVEVWDVFNKVLAKNPQDRFQTEREFVEALELAFA